MTDLEVSSRYHIDENGEIHLHSNFLLDEKAIPAACRSVHPASGHSVFPAQRGIAGVSPAATTRADAGGLCVRLHDVLLDLYGADVEYSADSLEDIYATLGKVGRQVLSETISDVESGRDPSGNRGRRRPERANPRQHPGYPARHQLPDAKQGPVSTPAMRMQADLAQHRLPEQPHLIPVRQDQLPDGRHHRLHQHQPEQADQSTDRVRRRVHANQHPGRHRRHVRIFNDDAGNTMAPGLWLLYRSLAIGILGWITYLLLKYFETRRAKKFLKMRDNG